MPEVTEAGQGGCVGLCRGHEVSRWWRADRGGAGPPGAGAVSGGGCDRGGGHRPAGRAAVPGDADVGESVAAGAGRRGPDLLLHRIGWSVQVPARQAAERDEAKIAAWKEATWPVIKGRRRTWGPGWSSRTNPARA